jgi:hypothetical protein
MNLSGIMRGQIKDDAAKRLGYRLVAMGSDSSPARRRRRVFVSVRMAWR